MWSALTSRRGRILLWSGLTISMGGFIAVLAIIYWPRTSEAQFPYLTVDTEAVVEVLKTAENLEARTLGLRAEGMRRKPIPSEGNPPTTMEELEAAEALDEQVEEILGEVITGPDRHLYEVIVRDFLQDGKEVTLP